MCYDMQGNPINDTIEWAKMFADTKSRTIGKTQTFFWTILTVWLGLDHNFTLQGPPLIFETMAFLRWQLCWPIKRVMLLDEWAWFYIPIKNRSRFGFKAWRIGWPWESGHGDYEQRYSTLAQAKGGHLDMVEEFSGLPGFINGLKGFFRTGL